MEVTDLLILQAIVGVVGHESLSHTAAAAATDAPTDWARTTMRRGSPQSQHQQQQAAAISGDYSEDWEDAAALSVPLPPLKGQQQRPRYVAQGEPRQQGDGSSSSCSSDSIGEEDLGWGGAEGSLDNSDLDLGQLVVPSVRRVGICWWFR